MPALTGTMVPPENKLTTSVPAMSDAVAAPVPTRSVPLRKPTSSEVASKIVAGLGAVQEVLGVFGAAKGFCVAIQPQRSGGAANVSIAASTERGMATRMRAVRSGTDAV